MQNQKYLTKNYLKAMLRNKLPKGTVIYPAKKRAYKKEIKELKPNTTRLWESFGTPKQILYV